MGKDVVGIEELKMLKEQERGEWGRERNGRMRGEGDRSGIDGGW